VEVAQHVQQVLTVLQALRFRRNVNLEQKVRETQYTLMIAMTKLLAVTALIGAKLQARLLVQKALFTPAEHLLFKNSLALLVYKEIMSATQNLLIARLL
jgi:hypothetical protein